MFQTNYKIWKAAMKSGQDEIRPNLEYVFFNDGYVYATDSHIMVKANLHSISAFTEEEINTLSGTSIHGSVLEKVFSHSADIEVKVDIDGRKYFKSVGDNECRYYLREDIKPMQFEMVVSSITELGVTNKVSAIGIKPKFLARLASAMGVADCLRLDMKGNDKGILLHDERDKKDILGILMPVLVDEPELDFPEENSESAPEKN